MLDSGPEFKINRSADSGSNTSNRVRNPVRLEHYGLCTGPESWGPHWTI